MVGLRRTAFEASRAGEYFDERELQALSGQRLENFGAVALKEAVDNSLDACEAAGVAPELDLRFELGATTRMAVADNGSGITPETVRRVLNFDTRTSDKAAYRTPTRGAQGNALKTVIGIPVALGTRCPVVIEARGVRHEISAGLDPAGEPRVRHDEETAPTKRGTRLELSLPAERLVLSPDRWARAFSLFNPHASVRIRVSDHGDYRANPAVRRLPDSYQRLYRRTAEFPGGFRKYLPTDLHSAHWYDAASLKRLVFSHIAELRRGGEDVLLRDFVRSFRGLSGSAKAKAVCDRFPDIVRLSDFEGDDERVAALLETMRGNSTAPSHDVLGVVGAEHFRRRFEEWYGVERFWYRKVRGCTSDGLPYVFEMALAETAEPGELFNAVNFSPTFHDPLAGTRFRGTEFAAYGIEGFLSAGHASPSGGVWGEPAARTAAAAHVVLPAPTFLDRGKTRLKLEERSVGAADNIAAAVWAVTRTLHKEEERRRRDAARQERAEHRRRRPSPGASLKAAVFEVLPEALEKATGGGALPASVRTLYYQVRPLIQPYTDKELEYDYFSQDLITAYREQHGRMDGLYYDPRGVLYEPHTNKSVPLGTREVDSYAFPSWLYDKILYIEKKGLYPVVRAARIAERYDMAVVAAEGYATEATRTLFENAGSDRDYQLYVLHDADPHGYNIARTLREETRRMPGYSVEVTDLGLKLEEALENGLQCEKASRKRKLPSEIVGGLSGLELEYFTGERKTEKSWVYRRVELNAMTAPQLVGFVEAKLRENGVRGKVVPPEEDLGKLAHERYRALAFDRVAEVVDELLNTDQIKKAVADELAGKFGLHRVREDMEGRFGADPALSWRAALTASLEDAMEPHADALRDAVKKRVEERLAR